MRIEGSILRHVVMKGLALVATHPWYLVAVYADKIEYSTGLNVSRYEDGTEAGIKAEDVVIENTTGTVVSVRISCDPIGYYREEVLAEPIQADNARVVLSPGRLLKFGMQEDELDREAELKAVQDSWAARHPQPTGE